MSIHRRRGFTLVELLVVVGIIAVLAALLMPVFARARRQARTVQCLSNLRQIGMAFAAYVAENKGAPPPATVSRPMVSGPLVLEPLLEPQAPEADSGVMFCPEAVEFGKPWNRGAVDFYPGTARHAWGEAKADPARDIPYQDRVKGSSYGMNGWAARALPPGFRDGDLMRDVFIRPGGSDGSAVPVFADAIAPVGMPLHTDRPPDNLYDPFFRALNTASEMQLFTVARHGRAVNVAFLDGHARTVLLEELWQLRWHNQFVATKVTLPPG